MSGFVEFAQIPGKASMVRSEAGLALVADTKYELQLREYGKIQRTGGGGVCEAGGLEFNPLTEVDKHGKVNPFQDPARGRIEHITADENGLAVFLQKNLLQNIDGKDGILGRLLTISSKINDVKTIVDCCVIGLDELPESMKEKPTESHGYIHAPHGHYLH